MKHFALALVLGAVAVALNPVDACAHRVIDDDGSHTNPEDAIVLNDFDLSQVVYHEVTESSNHLWFTFDAAAGQRLYWEFGLPALDRLEDYRPIMIVLGPGLPAIDLPFDIPEGVGGVVIDGNGEELEFFFEKFTSTNTWIIDSDERTIETPGTYHVVAYQPEGEPGKFWVAIGKREEYGLNDVLIYADILRFVRDYHEDSTERLSPLNWSFLILSYLVQIIAWPIMFIRGLLGV